MWKVSPARTLEATGTSLWSVFLARMRCPTCRPRTSCFQPLSWEKSLLRLQRQPETPTRHDKLQVIFVVELVIRLGAERRGFFEGEEKWWSLGYRQSPCTWQNRASLVYLYRVLFLLL